MPITGSQKAPLYAIMDSVAVPNVAGWRIGATRLDYYKPQLLVDINGSRVANALKSSIHIESNHSSGPSRSTVILRGVSAPTPGHTVKIGLGTSANPLFGGRIMQVQEVYQRASQRYPRWRCQCVDASWELDHHRSPGQRWVATSASTIAAALIALAPSLTASVQPGLLDVDFEVAVDELISSALNRLAKLCDGYYFVKSDGTVRFETTSAGLVMVDGSVPTRDSDVTIDRDVSQIRNRVHVIGGGPTAAQEAAVGASVIYVEDVASWFDSAGGTVVAGPQTITYTGYIDDATPRLTGVSGVLYTIPVGMQVRVLVTRNNTIAQTALATLLGSGDGVVAHSIADDTLDVDGAEFVGDAELAKYQANLETLSFKTRNKFLLAGQRCTVSISPITTVESEFVVRQSVIDGIASDRVWPLRSVTLGPWQRDLFKLLQQLYTKKQGA